MFDKSLGGKWTYDKTCCWFCDDGRRFIAHVAMHNRAKGYYLYLYGVGKPKEIIFESTTLKTPIIKRYFVVI